MHSFLNLDAGLQQRQIKCTKMVRRLFGFEILMKARSNLILDFF